jgi:hypothetical protein
VPTRVLSLRWTISSATERHLRAEGAFNDKDLSRESDAFCSHDRKNREQFNQGGPHLLWRRPHVRPSGSGGSAVLEPQRFTVGNARLACARGEISVTENQLDAKSA